MSAGDIGSGTELDPSSKKKKKKCKEITLTADVLISVSESGVRSRLRSGTCIGESLQSKLFWENMKQWNRGLHLLVTQSHEGGTIW